jgi:hypothetical protein
VALVAWASSIGGAGFRRQALVLLLVSLAIYASIALGRANMYRMFGVSSLEAARQLRYHYVSTIPLALLVSFALLHVARRTRVAQLPLMVLVAWVSANAYRYWSSDWSIGDHADCRQFVTESMREIDSKIDAAPLGANVEITNKMLPPLCTGIMGYEAIPGWAGLFVLFYPDNQVRGRNVYFLEAENQEGLYDDPKHRRLWKTLLPP